MAHKVVVSKIVPSPEEERFLEDRIYECNCDQIGQNDGRTFAILLRDDRRQVVGGLSGWTWAGACEIKTLWVHPTWRKQGHGRTLLESAEREVEARGCEVIMVNSYSFQAPAFYRKCGYVQVWQLNDFPPGHQHCCLVKRLERNSRPTEG